MRYSFRVTASGTEITIKDTNAGTHSKSFGDWLCKVTILQSGSTAFPDTKITFSSDSEPGSVEASPGVVFGGGLHITSSSTLAVDIRHIQIGGNLTVNGTVYCMLASHLNASIEAWALSLQHRRVVPVGWTWWPTGWTWPMANTWTSRSSTVLWASTPRQTPSTSTCSTLRITCPTAVSQPARPCACTPCRRTTPTRSAPRPSDPSNRSG